MPSYQTVSVGERRHLVRLQQRGPAVPDGEGGTTSAAIDGGPWFVAMRAASAGDIERFAAGTIITTGGIVVTGDYRATVTTNTELLFQGRTLHVAAVINRLLMNVETEVLVYEVV